MNHQDGDNPDFLDGLGDMLPADVLKKLNELLARLHQADHTNHGSTVINIYEKGSMHIDRVDNQNLYGDTSHKPKKASKAEDPSATPQPPLPAMLRTPEAMALWEKAQSMGYVDANYQPLISRTQAALLADAMARRLGIKEKWKVFEALWNRKYMRSDYNLALSQQQSLDFQDELKSMFLFRP